jgi:hypothetical protein
MKQKTFKLTVSTGKKGLTLEDPIKVAEFAQRLNTAMKEVRRDFQRKSRASAERAAKIVLNA